MNRKRGKCCCFFIVNAPGKGQEWVCVVRGGKHPERKKIENRDDLM